MEDLNLFRLCILTDFDYAHKIVLPCRRALQLIPWDCDVLTRFTKVYVLIYKIYNKEQDKCGFIAS